MGVSRDLPTSAWYDLTMVDDIRLRRSGEPEKVRRAFFYYAAMRDRSHRRLAEEIGVSKSLVGRWSKTWDWVERLGLYDQLAQSEQASIVCNIMGDVANDLDGIEPLGGIKGIGDVIKSEYRLFALLDAEARRRAGDPNVISTDFSMSLNDTELLGARSGSASTLVRWHSAAISSKLSVEAEQEQIDTSKLKPDELEHLEELLEKVGAA